jgi:outer membrane protein assembly factor BamA
MRELIAAVILALVFCHAQAQALDCAASMPSNAELEAAGVRIDKIILRPQNIFDHQDFARTAPDTAANTAAPRLPKLYRLANQLHIATKPAALRAQLIFAEGDLYSARVLEESARTLRKLRYLREPVLSPICYRPGTADSVGLVDVQVQTRDVWTLAPTLTLGRKGGKNTTSFGVEDNNFLGYGKVLEVFRRTDRKRTTSTLGYHDPNVGFGRWSFDAVLTNANDGHNIDLRTELPFFALDSRRQMLFAASDFDGEQTREVFGMEVDRYRQQTKQGEISFGFSNGLVRGWTRRYFTGLRYQREQFAALAQFLPGLSSLPAPADRELLYPFVRIEGVQDDFATTFNQDQIGRTEDQVFGMQYSLELGQSARALGSDRTRTLLRASISDGQRIRTRERLFFNAYAQARLGGGGEHQLIGAAVRYFYRQSDKASFYTGFSADLGRNLDADAPLVSGGENGLRGYPFNYQYGSKRALLSVEQRYYTDWKPFQLVQVGAAAFVDVGKLWGASPVPAPQLGTLRDIGVGLRLGSLRAARANALHIDLAYPLDGRKQDRGLQLTVETKVSF